MRRREKEERKGGAKLPPLPMPAATATEQANHDKGSEGVKRRREKGGGEKAKRKKMKREEGKGKRERGGERREGEGANLPSCLGRGKKWLDGDPREDFFFFPFAN